MLEWTTEDWARWIEEPPVTRPAPEPDSSPPGQDEPAEAVSAPAAPEDDPRIEGDPTGTWSLVMDQDEGDAGWWSSVAGLEGAAPVVDPPPVMPPAPPIDTPTPPIDTPAPAPWAPTTDVLSALPQSTRRAVDTAPSPSRRVSLDTEPEDRAVRVRAGLSLLGVSILVGAVTAGVITVALFMAAVVLRRALG